MSPQAVGNGGRPAPHHPVPGNMRTEGLSMADWPQKKKKNLEECVLVSTKVFTTATRKWRVNLSFLFTYLINLILQHKTDRWMNEQTAPFD